MDLMGWMGRAAARYFEYAALAAKEYRQHEWMDFEQMERLTGKEAPKSPPHPASPSLLNGRPERRDVRNER
jgi:hypothetical protein